MSSVVHKRGPTAPEMNITPLIDVVFQLIIFFMLVNNIVSQEAVEMLVPKLDNPRTREMGEVNRVVVNVVPEPFSAAARAGDPLAFDGTARMVQVGTNRYPLDDLTAVTEALRYERQKNPQVHVLLRADSALFYEEVQPVMSAISQAGISTVNLVAYMPGEGPAQAQQAR